MLISGIQVPLVCMYNHLTEMQNRRVDIISYIRAKYHKYRNIHCSCLLTLIKDVLKSVMKEVTFQSSF